MRTVLGAFAGAGKGAGAPAVDVIFADMNTTANIGNYSRVDAVDDVTVLAFNEQDIIGVSIAIAGAQQILKREVDAKAHADVLDELVAQI